MPVFKSIRNKEPWSHKPGLRSLAECWEYFRGQVIPEANEGETERARMVFYSGAAFFYDQAMAIGDDKTPEAAGEAHLASWAGELKEFAMEMELRQSVPPGRTH